jgi:hypothetical protein
MENTSPPLKQPAAEALMACTSAMEAVTQYIDQISAGAKAEPEKFVELLAKVEISRRRLEQFD